jgi:hypothetical protein
MASLIRGGPRGLHGIVDPPLGLLLGDTGPPARQLGEPSEIFRGDRARSDGARD